MEINLSKILLSNRELNSNKIPCIKLIDDVIGANNFQLIPTFKTRCPMETKEHKLTPDDILYQLFDYCDKK